MRDADRQELVRRALEGDLKAATKLVAELRRHFGVVPVWETWTVLEESAESGNMVRGVFDSPEVAHELAATLLVKDIRTGDRHDLDDVFTFEDAEWGAEEGPPVTKREVFDAFDRKDWETVLQRGHDFVRWAWREKHRVSYTVEGPFDVQSVLAEG